MDRLSTRLWVRRNHAVENGERTRLACSVPRQYLFTVAQIANLPCRRLPIGRALAELKGSGQGAVLQDGILRYSKLAVCATGAASTLNTYRRPRGTVRGRPNPDRFVTGVSLGPTRERAGRNTRG